MAPYGEALQRRFYIAIALLLSQLCVPSVRADVLPAAEEGEAKT